MEASKLDTQNEATPPPFPLPSLEALAKVHALAERSLSPEEFEAIVSAPVSESEREDTLALIEWFTRRYPTPGERLAYVRRAYARWKRGT